MTDQKIKIKKEAWVKQAQELFGEDPMDWAFVCPSCGWVATVRDWRDAGALNQAAFSCIGRALGSSREIGSADGPCNYAGGGLFRLNPVIIIEEDGVERETFAFAKQRAKSPQRVVLSKR